MKYPHSGVVKLAKPGKSSWLCKRETGRVVALFGSTKAGGSGGCDSSLSRRFAGEHYWRRMQQQHHNRLRQVDGQNCIVNRGPLAEHVSDGSGAIHLRRSAFGPLSSWCRKKISFRPTAGVGGSTSGSPWQCADLTGSNQDLLIYSVVHWPSCAAFAKVLSLSSLCNNNLYFSSLTRSCLRCRSTTHRHLLLLLIFDAFNIIPSKITIGG